MNNCCNDCNRPTCGGCCEPARYGCMFGIQANPYDASYWNVTINGMTHKVKIPSINETDTALSTDYSSATLNYRSEKHTDQITGRQLGQLINLDDLRDVDAELPDACSMLVFNPGCNTCGNGCEKIGAMWRPYHIPDAGDCVLEPDSEGYYHVLKKTNCGCPVECRLPIMPAGMTALDYTRDSVPDDPDFPWYYGIYNDTINLYLAQNAPAYFGKYALKVTVNYGIQVTHPTVAKDTNFRSLVVPVVEGTSINVSKQSSILQGQSGVDEHHPWGTVCMRSSFTFLVPKGKEAYLHHEFRLRALPNPAKYLTSQYDGQKVPDDVAGRVDAGLWTMSRLNALQVIIEPTQGAANYSPVVDDERSQLDDPIDEYPPISG